MGLFFKHKGFYIFFIKSRWPGKIFSFSFCRPKAKSPPQDLLLKLEKEQTFKELSLETSMFVFKLGLAKRQCCLLMNGLVLDSNEVDSTLIIIIFLRIKVIKKEKEIHYLELVIWSEVIGENNSPNLLHLCMKFPFLRTKSVCLLFERSRFFHVRISPIFMYCWLLNGEGIMVYCIGLYNV